MCTPLLGLSVCLLLDWINQPIYNLISSAIPSPILQLIRSLETYTQPINVFYLHWLLTFTYSITCVNIFPIWWGHEVLWANRKTSGVRPWTDADAHINSSSDSAPSSASSPSSTSTPSPFPLFHAVVVWQGQGFQPYGKLFPWRHAYESACCWRHWSGKVARTWLWTKPNWRCGALRMRGETASLAAGPAQTFQEDSDTPFPAFVSSKRWIEAPQHN